MDIRLANPNWILNLGIRYDGNSRPNRQCKNPDAALLAAGWTPAESGDAFESRRV